MWNFKYLYLQLSSTLYIADKIEKLHYEKFTVLIKTDLEMNNASAADEGNLLQFVGDNSWAVGITISQWSFNCSVKCKMDDMSLTVNCEWDVKA